MTRPAKPAGQRWLHLGINVVLVIGAIPIALPFLWLVLSSLKTADNVLTDHPEWLPIVHRCTIQDGAAEKPVAIVDESRGDLLGCWRVKPADSGDQPWFYWPADEIRERTVTGHVALIGGVKRAITAPRPGDDLEHVRVGLLGTQRVQPIDADTLREETVTSHVVTVLGQDLPVALSGAADADGAGPASLRLLEAGQPFDIADTLIRNTSNGPCLIAASLGNAAVPIEILATHAAAGISRVRLVADVPIRLANVHLTPLTRVRTHYWLRHAPDEIEVKPTRRDATGRPVEVAILGQAAERVVPVTDVSTAARTQCEIRWLDQTLTVRCRPDVATPPGLLALQTVSPQDTVVVAAACVRQTRELAPQWSNYVNVFRAEPLHKYVLNTLFITALSIIGNVLSCGLVGYAFARLQFRGRDALFLILLSTMMLPATITFLPTYILYVKLGWLDTFLPMIVPTFLATAAFYVFLYRQFFLTIPLDLEDAARIDGCGPLATFWHIMLPMARPAVVTVTVFTFMGAWNDFMSPLLYINTDEYQTLAYGLYSFKTSFGYKFPHYMMAAATMMMIPTLIIFLIAQKAFVRGVVVTGVKG